MTEIDMVLPNGSFDIRLWFFGRVDRVLGILNEHSFIFWERS